MSPGKGNMRFCFLVLTSYIILPINNDVCGNTNDVNQESLTQCEDFLKFCAECNDGKEVCRKIQACGMNEKEPDCITQMTDNFDLTSKCDTCSKLQEECASAPEGCTKGKKPWFQVPTLMPIGNSKPGNKPPKNCKSQDQVCTETNDPLCCKGLTCEETAEAGKFKCTLLVHDQVKPSNSSTAMPPRGCR